MRLTEPKPFDEFAPQYRDFRASFSAASPHRPSRALNEMLSAAMMEGMEEQGGMYDPVTGKMLARGERPARHEGAQQGAEPVVAWPRLMLLKKKHPLAIRWFHWINFPVLAIMVWSGFLIYWANDVYAVKVFGFEIHFFPDSFYHPTIGWLRPGSQGPIIPYTLDHRLAEGMAWHFAFMWFFTINGALYVLYLLFSGEWRQIVPNLKSFGQAIHVVMHDLHLSKKPLPVQKFNGAQKFAYTGVILMGFGSLVTGLAIYKPWEITWLTNLLGGYEFARILHFALMIGFCLFFGVHVLQVMRAGWNNFRAMVTGYELVKSGQGQEE